MDNCLWKEILVERHRVALKWRQQRRLFIVSHKRATALECNLWLMGKLEPLEYVQMAWCLDCEDYTSNAPILQFAVVSVANRPVFSSVLKPKSEVRTEGLCFAEIRSISRIDSN